ncbi:MAG: hypothetical protein GC190_21850 [Alphaproteobacteria bacterium]|nr:hypothetical protein [Alphaproteobacteria bacterium]
MGLPIHIMELIEGSTPLNSDRLFVGVQNQVANVAGGGADVVVSTAVAFTAGKLPPTDKYGVFISPDQNCTWWISARTTTGFTVNQKPPSGGTLAAGKFDVLVTA